MCHSLSHLPPTKDSRTPTEPGSETGHGDHIAGLHLSAADGLIKSQGDGAGGCVAILVEVGNHLIHGDAQLLGDSLHDTNIGLMHKWDGHATGASSYLT